MGTFVIAPLSLLVIPLLMHRCSIKTSTQAWQGQFSARIQIVMSHDYLFHEENENEAGVPLAPSVFACQDAVRGQPAPRKVA